jgi:hypothetical protein
MAQPAAVSAAHSRSRRAAYRARCSSACSSSSSAAAIAACTGVGIIIPACLRISSRSAMSSGSPVTNPARYPAMFDRLDSECTASSPWNVSAETSGCRIDTGRADQPSSM